MEFVRWDDEIPNMMGKIIQMFQTTNQSLWIKYWKIKLFYIGKWLMGRFPQTIVLNDQRVKAPGKFQVFSARSGIVNNVVQQLGLVLYNSQIIYIQ